MMNYSSEPVEGQDYYLYQVPLPYNIGGATVANNDGACTVYINSLRSEVGKREAFEHEMVHLREDHLYQHDRSAEELEAEADGLSGGSPFSETV